MPFSPFLDCFLGIVHKEKISDSYKCIACQGCYFNLVNPSRCLFGCLTCSCICDYCYFEERIQPRSYQAIYENRIEFNYPWHACCGRIVCDQIVSKHFDRVHNFQEAKCCTPFHILFCTCVGDVLAEAPCACLNCAVCCCCRTFYPSINNADGFLLKFKEANDAFQGGNRLIPRFLPAGPTPGDVIQA